MTKRFIPVLAACLFLMVGTAQAATSLAFPPPDTKVYVTDTQKNSKELFAAMHTGSAYQNVGLFCASVGLHNVVRASYDAEGLASALGLPNSKHILISQSIGWGE